MTKILYVLQMWIQKPHQLNNGMRVPLPFLLILQAQQVLDHLLNMSPIFTHYQVIPRGIIFHTLVLERQIYWN